MSSCDTCGNAGAILAPHTGKVLCDCCSTSLLIGPHECLSHAPAGSTKPSEFCTCDTYTGSERNRYGVKVCERCGKPDDPRDERPFP